MHGIPRDLSQFWHRSFLSRQIFLELSFGLLLITSYSSLALTAKTSNIINGNAPYLTFDGGRTQTTNTDGLLGISLSNGDKYTPTTNSSSLTNPIVLPSAGQSFADIGMLMPTNTDSIALNSLIGPPYNYWGDDDGDGQDINGITATGNLSLTISDKNNQLVARSQILDICKAPYKLTLSNTQGILKTSYGVPNESRFSASNVIYYINPKAPPVICFVKPDMLISSGRYAGPATIWNPEKGFIPQSVTPSSYGLNFPTTGAHNLYFDLDIGGSNQALSWAPVSLGGITATMTNSTNTSVRVTLTGPFTTEFIDNAGSNVGKPSLPQIFELVGRDSLGNNVIKYGFELKQWFVNRGTVRYDYSGTSSWCTGIGYRMPDIKDLTNSDFNNLGATPSSSGNYYQRRINAGFFTEWGAVGNYIDANFLNYGYWGRVASNNKGIVINSDSGNVHGNSATHNGLCAYP